MNLFCLLFLTLAPYKCVDYKAPPPCKPYITACARPQRQVDVVREHERRETMRHRRR